MMTYAWLFMQTLDENLKPRMPSKRTEEILLQLLKQLTVEQRLYAEIRWREIEF